MPLNKKRMAELANCLEIQGRKGNWDFDGYMCGMFNGMELMMAIVEGRDPAFRSLKNMPDMSDHKFHKGGKNERV